MASHKIVLAAAATVLLAGCVNGPFARLRGSKDAVPAPTEAIAPPPPDTVTVRIVGDVMLHAKQMDRDYSEFLELVAGPMRDADISVANMEFTMAGKPYSGYPAFSAPDEYAWIVCSQLGLDVAMLANNHILDRYRVGLTRTLKQYDAITDSLGTQYTGAASDSTDLAQRFPLLVQVPGKDVTVAFLNFTYGVNRKQSGDVWPRVVLQDRADIAGAIGRAQDAGADFIVALPHWGEEYNISHNEAQEDLAEWLVNQGVDAIVGCHPHVLQDTSVIRGVPVVYSTGNIVSNMSVENTRLGLMVTLRLVKEIGLGADADSVSRRVLPPEFRYTWCTLPGRLIDNYRTIFVDEMAGRRDEWLRPSDYDNMIQTFERLQIQ